MLKRPVATPLGAVRKAARRKLPAPGMIAAGFTPPLAGAGVMAAVARRQVLLLFAFLFKLLKPISQMSNSKYQTISNELNSKI